MVLDCGGSERHGATKVRYLQPGAAEIFRRRTFRQHTNRPLVHYLRDEFVGVEERPGNGGEERSLACATRVVADVSHFGRFVAS